MLFLSALPLFYFCLGQTDGCLPVPFPNGTSLSSAFVTEGFVGQLVTAPPTVEAKVTFNNVQVQVGQLLTPTSLAANQPTSITWSNCDQTAYYTVVLVDADLPQPGNGQNYLSPWRLWAVNNVLACQVGTGTTVTTYQAPGTLGQGEHRVALLVYRQNGPLSAGTLNEGNRQTWSPLTYSAQNNLMLVAGTYFKIAVQSQFG